MSVASPAPSHVARIACVACPCDDSCPGGGELQPLDGLLCTSLMVNEAINLFTCHSYVCFGKIPVQVFAFILKINILFGKNFRSIKKLQQWHGLFLSTLTRLPPLWTSRIGVVGPAKLGDSVGAFTMNQMLAFTQMSGGCPRMSLFLLQDPVQDAMLHLVSSASSVL